MFIFCGLVILRQDRMPLYASDNVDILDFALEIAPCPQKPEFFYEIRSFPGSLLLAFRPVLFFFITHIS